MARHGLTAIAYGLSAAMLIVLASAVLLASLLRFSSYSENGSIALPIIISLAALFIGGMIAGSKMKERGLLIGALTGVSYCLFSLLFQYLGLERMPGLLQEGLALANIAAAAVGGTMGVNLSGAAKRSNPPRFGK
ncbi:MAG: TIGR04086 family membrane protein [Sporolactobacillus sp.]